MKYKILFACNSYFPAIGGAEKVCATMVDILSKEYDVTVLTQYHPDRKDKKDIVELASTSSYSYMPKLKEYLNNTAGYFDLYISFGYGKYFSDAIMRWCKKHNKKSIFMPCGDFHTNQNDIKKILYSAFFGGAVFKNASKIITATEWEQDHWAHKYNIYPSKIAVIPYNLEKEFTKYDNIKYIQHVHPRIKNKKYLLYIGRAGPNKLLPLLIAAYKKTSMKLPLVIAGKGTDSKEYRDLVDTDQIIFLGTVTEMGKKNLISHAKLCAFPTNYESFGMVLLEAVALKTPVIGSDIGPFRELLKSPEYLFPNDISALAEKIEWLFSNNLPVPKIKLPNFEKGFLKVVGDLLEGPRK